MLYEVITDPAVLAKVAPFLCVMGNRVPGQKLARLTVVAVLIRVFEKGRIPPHEFLLGIADDVAITSVDPDNPVLQVHMHDPHGRLLECRAEALLVV